MDCFDRSEQKKHILPGNAVRLLRNKFPLPLPCDGYFLDNPDKKTRKKSTNHLWCILEIVNRKISVVLLVQRKIPEENRCRILKSSTPTPTFSIDCPFTTLLDLNVAVAMSCTFTVSFSANRSISCAFN